MPLTMRNQFLGFSSLSIILFLLLMFFSYPAYATKDGKKINLTKTSSPTFFSGPGQMIRYSYFVLNGGNKPLTNVTVTDPQPGLSPISCPTTNLEPDQSETCTAMYTTTQADVDSGGITNTGTAIGTLPNGQTVDDESTLTVPATFVASILLTKSSSPSSFSNPGTVITYSFLVKNTGNVNLSNVTVTDDKLGAISCPSSTLAPGVSETCHASYTITQLDVDAGSVRNTGSASGTLSTGHTVTADSTLTVPSFIGPSILLTKAASPTSFSRTGEVITFSYLVKNTGNVSLTSVGVTDPQPGLSAISCPTTNLAPDQSETCTATYTTTQADLNAGSITNTATASATPPSGLPVTVDSSLSISAGSSLTIVKLAVGGNQTFNFNSTISEASNFTLTTTQGKAQTSFSGLASGVYSISEVKLPFGWTLTHLECNGTPMSGSTATFALREGQSMTCTFTNTFESGSIRQKTLEDIAAFLNDRASLILTNQPNRRRIVERFSECFSRKSPINFAPSIHSGHAGFAVSSSLRQLGFSNAGFKPDIWAEVHEAYFNDHLGFGQNHTGNFNLIYLGSDYLLTHSLLGGILFQLDTIHITSDRQYEKASGVGWMAGPYFSTRLLYNLYLHTRAAWGTSRNSLDPFGQYEDNFNTTRSLYNAELTGDWIRNSFRISPSIGITSFDETQLAYTNDINIDIPSQTIHLGQLNFGPDLGYQFVTSRGYLVDLGLRLQGLYYFNQTPNTFDGADISSNRFNAQIEFRAGIKFPWMKVYPVVGYNGIGNTVHSLQEQVQFEFLL